MKDIPPTGFLRERDIVDSPATKNRPAKKGLLPICASTWRTGVRSGRFPKPTHALGPNITAWRVEDIIRLIESLAPKEAA